MQHHKDKFSDTSYYDTFSNVQSCLRLNDIEEIGDLTHFLYFNMIGFFSFREYTIEETIDFFLEFLNRLKLKPDYVTIHPDKMAEWQGYYSHIEIRPDPECVWSDGNIGGYCTEFYINDVEIGNIVNTLGTCIDVGFGLERLEYILSGRAASKIDTLKETIIKIIDSGIIPGNKNQGYVLRRLMRMLYHEGGNMDHPYFSSEIRRQEQLKNKYLKLKDKFPEKTKEWWFDTHGINIDLF